MAACSGCVVLLLWSSGPQWRGSLSLLGGQGPSGFLAGGVGSGAWWCLAVLLFLAFVPCRTSFTFLLFFAGVVFGEELVLEVPQVGRVDDLVEVLSGFFQLLKWIRGCPVVAEMIRGSVGSVYHESGFE